ncbi:MAG: hypothetical protein KGQ89_07640 [Verrucomicrobia bacterium]|nr:hypothetical protein [Verrucomicrobiota bacterium]
MNRISIDSTVLGIHRIPPLMASTKVRNGKHEKSSWTKVASWFSNLTERQKAQPQKKSAARKKLLTDRPENPSSQPMNVTDKTRDGHCHTAVAMRFSSLPTAQSAWPAEQCDARPLYTSSAPPFTTAPPFSRSSILTFSCPCTSTLKAHY